VINLTGAAASSAIGKALRLPLRIVPKDQELPILQGPMRGKKWIAGSSLHSCWIGTYEFAKQKYFIAALKPGHVVYDLGANVGFYSLLASVLVGPSGQVFSFEPLPRNIDLLKKHLALNKVRNCTLIEAAVGSSAHSAQFSAGPNSLQGRLSASLDKNAIQVQVVSLDPLVSSGRLPAPNLIKCDIEGAEFDALAGALDVLKKHTPTLLLATHSSEVHGRCCSLLSELKYNLQPIDGLPLSQSQEVLATPSNMPFV
jgi:FkbM family methyltransferase